MVKYRKIGFQLECLKQRFYPARYGAVTPDVLPFRYIRVVREQRQVEWCVSSYNKSKLCSVKVKKKYSH